MITIVDAATTLLLLLGRRRHCGFAVVVSVDYLKSLQRNQFQRGKCNETQIILCGRCIPFSSILFAHAEISKTGTSKMQFECKVFPHFENWIFNLISNWITRTHAVKMHISHLTWTANTRYRTILHIFTWLCFKLISRLCIWFQLKIAAIYKHSRYMRVSEWTEEKKKKTWNETRKHQTK